MQSAEQIKVDMKEHQLKVLIEEGLAKTLKH